nr:dephospho-CoA kinase [Acholeplasma laidlawii]
MPLLFESNYTEFDESILIDTTEALQLKRLMLRNKYTQEEALVRIKAQLPLAKKRKLATHIIKNNGSIDALYEKIDKLLERYV